jgi:hypothetical protein
MGKKIILPEGVFIDGKPLFEYLVDKERDRKSTETEEVRKEAEGRKYGRRTGSYADERQEVDTRRVSKRVKYWSPQKIRKEYGIMEKPFASHAENAIWVMMEKGPIGVTDIGKEMDWKGKHNSLSAMVAGAWARLGNKHEGAAGILDRESDHGSFRYFKAKGVDISVEAAIEKYRLVGRKQYQAKNGRKKLAEAAAAEGEERGKPIGIERDVDKVKVEETLSSAIEEAVRNTLGLKVEVSGRIDIVFRLGGLDGS